MPHLKSVLLQEDGETSVTQCKQICLKKIFANSATKNEKKMFAHLLL